MKDNITETGCASRCSARNKLLRERHGKTIFKGEFRCEGCLAVEPEQALPWGAVRQARCGPASSQLEGTALILTIPGDIGFNEFE